MPRPPRIFFERALHHITARGNNKMDLFRDPNDFRIYRRLWVIAKARFALKVFRWTLMTNHIHFLIEQQEEDGVAEAMHFVQSRYARYFCRKYSWKGHVWESRYSNRLILDDRYFRQCSRYIEENPVRAGIVNKAADYPWSSAAFYSYGYLDPLTDVDPYLETETEQSHLKNQADKQVFFGRRAVGTIDKLKSLSLKTGKNLLAGRQKPQHL